MVKRKKYEPSLGEEHPKYKPQGVKDGSYLRSVFTKKKGKK